MSSHAAQLSVLCSSAVRLTAIFVQPWRRYAWLVEFSSKHCQSCKEFAPRWHELTHEFPELHFAHVSIDVPEGKALAKELGALREVSLSCGSGRSARPLNWGPTCRGPRRRC